MVGDAAGRGRCGCACDLLKFLMVAQRKGRGVRPGQRDCGLGWHLRYLRGSLDCGAKGIQVPKLGMVLQNHLGAPDSEKKGTPDTEQVKEESPLSWRCPQTPHLP